jgi:hypothetical protein
MSPDLAGRVQPRPGAGLCGVAAFRRCAAAAVLLLTYAGTGSAWQETQRPNPPYVERNQRQISFYPGGKIEITAGIPGSIEVQGWDRPTVTIESERIVYYLPQDQAKALADKYPLRVRHGQTSVTITTEGPPKSPVSMETNLKLFVPKAKTDLKIAIFKGDLAVSRINGWVEANMGQGNVEVLAMEGYFSVITKEGDLSVELAGKRWLGQGFTAVTNRGSADLRLPAAYSASLQIETHNGDFTIDFPEQLVEGEKVPLLAVVKDKARSLSATVGDGGAPVRVFTEAGNIRLTATDRR